MKPQPNQNNSTTQKWVATKAKEAKISAVHPSKGHILLLDHWYKAPSISELLLCLAFCTHSTSEQVRARARLCEKYAGRVLVETAASSHFSLPIPLSES